MKSSNATDAPEGWSLAALREVVVNVQPGFACGAHNRDGNGVSHLRPMNVNGEGRIDLSDLKFVPKSQVDRDERWVRQGDVIFNNTNSPELVGKTALYTLPERRAFSNHMTRVRCNNEAVDPAFCAAYLHQQWRTGYFLRVCNNHVSQASVASGVLLDTEIDLPPLAEQRRIVAKVEELLARVDAARERLAKVPAILRRFRQSILAAACSGQLTADWRYERGETECVADLVRDLKREHQLRRKAATHARRGANAARNQSDTDGGLDLSELPELPDSWCYVRASEVVEPGTVITYGIVLPGPQVQNGTPYVRGLDIEGGRVLVDQLWRTDPAIAAKHERSRLEPGDVLLCVIRHLKVAIAPPSLEGANLTQGTVRMRPSRLIKGQYLASYLASPYAQDWMKSRYFGMDMPRINVEDARAIPIPVPPPSEQNEIARRVEALFALADKIEARVHAATARVEKITQAILAKAFRGELVETEAELARRESRPYEPASALLDRIRTERQSAALNGAPKRGGRKRSEVTTDPAPVHLSKGRAKKATRTVGKRLRSK